MTSDGSDDAADDRARVDELRATVEAGEYRVDADDVAEAILQFHLILTDAADVTRTESE